MNTIAVHKKEPLIHGQFISEREIEVLREMSAGFTDVEIGRKLFLSHYTIQGYRKQLFLKLGARNSCHLVYRACQFGLI